MSRQRGAYYIDDDELYYHIILSKGKGQLTPKCLTMFLLIGENFIRIKQKNYWGDETMLDDSYQSGMLMLLNNWKNFNEKRYSKALPYLTEVFKRGMTKGFNEIYDFKKNAKTMDGYDSYTY